jgi:DNA-binding XRE family transcriptional regulator
MDNIQIIETPKGEKMAVIPLSEYTRLRHLAESEDARDVRDADTIMAGVRSGKTALIPHAVVKAIAVGGIHPIRAFREHKGWTAEALAKKAKLTRTTITQIETRQRTGTVAAYTAIAKALGMNVDPLLDTANEN